jgi:hypothetical protein
MRKVFNAFRSPHHVSTLMKKIVGLLMQTPKDLYGQRYKHIYWVMGINHHKGHP